MRLSIGKKISLIVILVGIMISANTSLLIYEFIEIQSEKASDEVDVLGYLVELEELILLSGIVITIIIGAAAFALSKKISRPINELKKASNEITKGDFEVRTNIKTGDEVEDLSQAFDFMAKKLQESKMAINLREELIERQDEILLKFSEGAKNCPVCIIDIAQSTKTTAKLSEEQTSKFYGIFINEVNEIVNRYQGVVVKNLGDGMLFYFPKADSQNKAELKNVLDCCFDICNSHGKINEKFTQAGLPNVNYRISVTFGPVRIAKVSTSLVEDIFGSTVNRCAKINRMAQNNGIVVGDGFYQAAKDLNQFTFSKVKNDSIEKQFDYSVYTVLNGKN